MCTCSIDLGQLHDLVLDGWGHRHLVVADADMSAAIQQALGGTLQGNGSKIECLCVQVPVCVCCLLYTSDAADER